MPSRPLSWPALMVTGAAAADSIVASTARPFTWRADLTTAAGIVGIALVGLVPLWWARRRHLGRPEAAGHEVPRSGVLAWAAVATAMAAFEMVNFLLRPRSQHPTISSLLGVLTGHEVLRGLLFAAWLGAGWWLWGRS